MDQEILNAIFKDTYSLAQLKHRVNILKSNLCKAFFNGSGETVQLSVQDSNWLKSLPESFYKKFNKDNVYKIFTDIEKETVTLPVLTLHLTFEPDDAALSQIGAFARKTFGIPLILDIKLDPQLIAGAALAWKGVMRDYSLRAKIEEKKAEITEGFKKFLR